MAVREGRGWEGKGARVPGEVSEYHDVFSVRFGVRGASDRVEYRVLESRMR